MPDAHKNFALSTVATAPSPATSGTTLVVATGHGTRFPATPFNATVYPGNALPDPTNAEIVRVTNISTDTLTIVRTQEGSNARSIGVGDRIVAAITAKTLTDIETAQTGAQLLSVKNVKDPAYGAKGDAKVGFMTVSVGGTQVTITGGPLFQTPTFSPSDVGKEIHVEHGTTSGDRWLRTTIASYIDAQNVTISTVSVAGTSRVVVWGTNDTAAIESARSSLTRGERLHFPQGFYLSDGGHNMPAGTGFQGADKNETRIITTKTDAGHMFRIDGAACRGENISVEYAGYFHQTNPGVRVGGANNPIRSLRKGLLTNSATWLNFSGDTMQFAGFDVGIHHADGPWFFLRDVHVLHNWTEGMLLEAPTWPDYAVRSFDNCIVNNADTVFAGRIGFTAYHWREGGTTVWHGGLIQGNDYGIFLDVRDSTQEIRVNGTGFEDALINSIRIRAAAGKYLYDTVINGVTMSQLSDSNYIDIDGGSGSLKGIVIGVASAQANNLVNAAVVYVANADDIEVKTIGVREATAESVKRLRTGSGVTRLRTDVPCSARVHRTSNQSLGTDPTNVAVSWQASGHNQGSPWSSGTNPTRFTAPWTGMFRLRGNVSVSPADYFAAVRVFKNGSTTEDATNMPAYNGTQIPWTASQIDVPFDTGPVLLTAGDYLEVKVSTLGSAPALLSAYSRATFERVA